MHFQLNGFDGFLEGCKQMGSERAGLTSPKALSQTRLSTEGLILQQTEIGS